MKERVLILLFISVAAVLANELPPTATNAERADYRSGWREAEADMKHSVIRYEVIGLISPDWEELVREAKRRYHVDVLNRGCTVPPRVHGYADAVVHHLIQEYGHDPILDLHRELMRKYSGSH